MLSTSFVGFVQILQNNRAEFNEFYLTSRARTACHLSLTTSPQVNLALLLRQHPGDDDSCYCFRIQKKLTSRNSVFAQQKTRKRRCLPSFINKGAIPLTHRVPASVGLSLIQPNVLLMKKHIIRNSIPEYSSVPTIFQVWG